MITMSASQPVGLGLHTEDLKNGVQSFLLDAKHEMDYAEKS